HQGVLCWRLYRQVGWFLAPEDSVDIAGRAPVLVDAVRPIRDQASGGDEYRIRVHRRELVPGRQCDDLLAVNGRQVASQHDQSAIWLACKRGDVPFNLVGVAQADWAQLYS